jgi:hypothetical protein
MRFTRLKLARSVIVVAMLAVMVPLTAWPRASATELAGVPTPQGESPDDEWIEVRDGDLPIVISAPHGGQLKPDGIADRQEAVVLDDPGSLQFTLELADALKALTGRRPYVVVNHLARIKLDPNRSLALGAQTDPSASAAWKVYHDAIARAERLVANQCGWGMYFDLHSNGRPEPRVEFGYGLTVADLDRSDVALDDRQYALRSNWRSLATWSPLDLSELVRGPDSLGGRLEAHGYSVDPSPDNSVPPADYFDGGLSVALHGSRSGGALDATQIEVPYTLLDDARRPALVRLLAEAMVGFMNDAYGFDLASDGPPCTGYADVRMDDPVGPAVAALGSVSGLPICAASPRRLCPAEALTRGEAAEAVWRLLRPSARSETSPRSDPFADLPADPAQRQAVEGLGRLGVVQACSLNPRRYCPGGVETRVEAAFLGVRLAHGVAYVPPAPTGLFADAPDGHWSTWWLEAAYRDGLLSACGPASRPQICPEAPISRRDFARMVAAALAVRER